MKTLVPILCLLALAAAALVRLVGHGEPRGLPAPAVDPAPAPGPDPRRAEAPPSAGPSKPPTKLARATPSTRVLVELPVPTRTQPEREPLAGVLRGFEPGETAELSWTALVPELEGLRHPTAIDLVRLRALSVTSTCDTGGRFAFPLAPEGARAEESVVWITRPGREASAVVLPASVSGWRWSEGPDAPARAAVRVRVQRAGEPVAGVTLRHTLSFWEAGQTEGDVRTRRVFLRETRTGPDGSARIVAGSGENLLVALAEGERSISWLGQPQDEVVLELLPTIEVSGSVRVDDPGVELGQLRYHVSFHGAENASDIVVGGVSHGVRADGSFGPDVWPRAARARVQVLVSGGGVVPVRATLANPPPGGRVAFELATVRGHPFELAVATRDGQPAAGAELLAWHWNGTEWLPLARATTGADGHGVLHAPAGELALEVRKSGFTTWSLQGGERALAPQAGPPVEVVLRPAGVVTGLVHSASEPVSRFVVLAWNEDKTFHSQTLIEDEDGAFELMDVPRGETVHLFAYSDALPQSETAAFVLDEEPLELELELPTPRKARGRVIDSVTRVPVPTARIQHLTAGLGGLADYRGAVMPVQADGSFELDGFCPGRGGFTCQADGYEGLYYSTRVDDSDPIEVGLLALNPLAVLEVEVREQGVGDFTGYLAWNRSNAERPPTPLARDGTLRIPSRTGYYQLHVARPDRSVTHVTGEILPGETKRVRVDLTGGVELSVLLAEPPPDVGSWTVLASSAARDGEHWTKTRWSAERQAFVLRPLCAGDAVLELRDTAGALVAQRSVRLSEARQQSLTLAPGGERRRLRLVDGRGQPWRSRPVTVSLADASGWSQSVETDAQGEFVIGPLDATRVVLSAKLANESLAYGIEAALEADPARTTVVAADVGPRSLLRLMEQGRTLGGLGVFYGHRLGPRALEFGYFSDEDGLVRGPFLAPGVYTLRVNHRDFWPTTYPLAASDSPDPVPLELFSRATLALVVTTPAGRPLAGARLALEHAELGQSAADWLAAERIAARDGLVTDADGRFVLQGVPRGNYAWSCSLPDGPSAAGRFELAPREERTLPIRIATD